MKYVHIQSDRNIIVTPGLQMLNQTKVNSDIADRLKVQPTWPHRSITIRQGHGIYPAEIANWHSVKTLVKNHILTIGDETDDTEDDAKAAENKAKLDENPAGFDPVDDEPTEVPTKRSKKKAEPAKEEAKAEEPKAEEKAESLEELVEEEAE